jgi:alkanesulfonate monooxygenase SsuD/methylene tetrahydromethanopterin reductase-like flavin-dependent oxidoreductase (luciferase family)
VRTFLSLHGLNEAESRKLELGFASGRFPFSTQPYGVKPRNELEAQAWPALRGLVFQEATEILLRFLRGDVFSSRDVRPKVLKRELFRSDEDWARVQKLYLKHAGSESAHAITVAPFWQFDDVGVIPFEAPLDLLKLTIGAHDAATQALANQFMPVGVFNLSITPDHVIEETHQRMAQVYHPSGGAWSRSLMPRTVLVFVDDPKRARVGLSARERAEKAIANYWLAMEGTLDPAKVAQAVENALVGTPAEIAEQMRHRYHDGDRLMLWFDFNNHDNEQIKDSMRLVMQDVRREL